MTKQDMFARYSKFKADQEDPEKPKAVGRDNFMKLVAALTRATKQLSGVSYYLGKATLYFSIHHFTPHARSEEVLELLRTLKDLLERLRVVVVSLKQQEFIPADFELDHASLEGAYSAVKHAVKSSFYPDAQLPGQECDGDFAHCNLVCHCHNPCPCSFPCPCRSMPMLSLPKGAARTSTRGSAASVKQHLWRRYCLGMQ